VALRQDQQELAAAGDDALRRSDPNGTGIRRRRRGRGFSYLRADGAPVTDPRALARIKALVISPAWQDVWICTDPRGHIQAIGTDVAGRRQYRYHDLWREQRDQDKHERVEQFGVALAVIREAVCHHLDTRGLGRERVLAAAIRLIDWRSLELAGLIAAAGPDPACHDLTCGAPLAVAVAGTFAYRALTLWLPMPFALVSLAALRRLGKQALPSEAGSE
jgi:hypothetical protein